MLREETVNDKCILCERYLFKNFKLQEYLFIQVQNTRSSYNVLNERTLLMKSASINMNV